MKRYFLVSVVLMLFLAACANGDGDEKEASDEESMTDDGAMLPLEVEIVTDSEAFEPGQEGTIEAKVTQGDENVTDADEVEFEIWKQGDEDNREKVLAEHGGDGLYAIQYTFQDDGLYYVIAHVTARGLHNMPTKEFIVGDVDLDEHSDEASEDHYHTDNFSIHLMKPDIIETDRAAEWIVHLEKDGTPFTDADVRLEFWRTDAEKHDFVPAEEDNAGEYKAEWTLTESGEHHVQVHVEKDDLHEHIVRTFHVE